MSRYAVLGATGRTGRHLVTALLERGDEVVALGRGGRGLAASARAGARTVSLDLTRASVAELATSFTGCDGVLFAAGTTNAGAANAVDRDGSVRSVAAAQRSGVRRFVQISSIGAGDRIPPVIDTPEFAPYYAAKRAADANLRASDLHWTILEPGWLTDDPPTGRIRLGDRDLPMGAVPRADVAATMIAVLDDDRSVGRQWQLVAGPTPIAQAIAELL
ncbi:SDR family oxidoreductase [Herbiconiux sp. CPCC 205763]|uniref:SDR family oxidoreductase n=1 Tax=Herbiconiux aconitum TaxID=2970913 RepID=A0ABT2GSZ9_9MICO|nr:NAD(P)-binding oxidoreductase [Herbiconiux aconitum]MCS5719352.1 SDR family oxidoreductase [Herbiconiux aconitum]